MASPSQTNSGTPNGFVLPWTNWGKFNMDSFVILQWLNKIQTAMPVMVVASTGSGTVGPFGFVDILPLVNQVDSQGNGTLHVTVYNIPYFRLQGGSNAIIMDPAPGDIGICCFASRDISKVKATQKQSNPGSLRNYSFSDGMYLGGILNGTPTQFIQFNDDGITITSPTAIAINAPTVTITTSNFTVDGPMNVSGDINGDGVDLKTHTHSGVQSGSDDTGPPV